MIKERERMQACVRPHTHTRAHWTMWLPPPPPHTNTECTPTKMCLECTDKFRDNMHFSMSVWGSQSKPYSWANTRTCMYYRHIKLTCAFSVQHAVVHYQRVSVSMCTSMSISFFPLFFLSFISRKTTWLEARETFDRSLSLFYSIFFF